LSRRKVYFEIFEKEEPGGLLGVVELGGAAGFLAENVVDVFEDLFEHGENSFEDSGYLENEVARITRLGRCALFARGKKKQSRSLATLEMTEWGGFALRSKDPATRQRWRQWPRSSVIIR
jgi:hypothetical protein